MSDAALEDLGSDVVGRSADGALLLAFEIEFGGQSEVTELDLHLVVDEEVAEFDVAVDDAVRVQEAQGVDDLFGVALDLELVQPLAPLQQFVQTLVCAELQEDVDALAVFEEVDELRDVLVLDRAVNFDLAHQLLLGAAPLQRALVDNLGRRYRLRVALHELIALREAALAQKLSFDVISVADLPVLMLDTLFDDLSARVSIFMEVGGAAASLGSGLHKLLRGDAAAGARTSSGSACHVSSSIIV